MLEQPGMLEENFPTTEQLEEYLNPLHCPKGLIGVQKKYQYLRAEE